MTPTTRYAYDALGRQVATTDANGHTNAMSYDAAGQLVKEYHADGAAVSYIYDVLGRKIAVIDANANKTDLFYDRNNRLIQSRNALNQSQWYRYDELGNRIAVTSGVNTAAPQGLAPGAVRVTDGVTVTPSVHPNDPAGNTTRFYKVQDIDFSRKTVFVREGKNRKDRLLPVSDRALHWNKRYLEEVRPGLLWASTDPGFFYLTRERFNECWISRMVAKYIDKAHIGKHGACHMFRHALATAMLENGADLRYVQAMLGHEDPNTTQFYTHVAIRTLQAIHHATHPGCQSDKEAGAADEAAAQDKATSAE